MSFANLQTGFQAIGTALNSTLSADEMAMAYEITRGRSRQFMTFQSSFIVYMIALVSFVGWFFFAVRALHH